MHLVIIIFHDLDLAVLLERNKKVLWYFKAFLQDAICSTKTNK